LRKNRKMNDQFAMKREQPVLVTASSIMLLNCAGTSANVLAECVLQHLWQSANCMQG